MEETNAVNYTIQDSGARREFESGAVRDIQEGKGRCDLLPLSTVSEVLGHDNFLLVLDAFVCSKDLNYLLDAVKVLIRQQLSDSYGVMLDLSKHFENGAKKYGENNWKKGIPIHCYLDSAVRHYLKFRRGDSDEPHYIACIWNVLCAHWTMAHQKDFTW